MSVALQDPGDQLGGRHGAPVKPSRWRILAPILAMILVQMATLVPHPEHFHVHHEAPDWKEQTSRVLFSSGPLLTNLLHAPVFGALTLLLFWGLAAWSDGVQKVRLRAAMALTTVYAAVNELSQRSSPTRHPSLPDFALDLVGIVTTGVAILYLSRRRDLDRT